MASTSARQAIAETVASGARRLQLSDMNLTALPAELPALILAVTRNDAQTSIALLASLYDKSGWGMEGRLVSALAAHELAEQMDLVLGSRLGPDDEDFAAWARSLEALVNDHAAADILEIGRLNADIERLIQFSIDLEQFDNDNDREEAITVAKDVLAAVRRDLARGLHSIASVSFTTVDLSFNRLQRLPAELYDLPHLQELLLADNDLKDLPRLGEHGPPPLRVLAVSGNKLEHLDPDLLSIESLETISVRYNSLTELRLRPESEPVFSELDLSHNLLGHVDSRLLSPALLRLAAADCRLTEWPDLASCPRLDYLDVSKNELPSPGSATFSASQDLTYLNVSGNLISELPESIADLDLAYLDVSFNVLERLPVGLSELSGYVDLHVEGNPLPDTLLRAAELGSSYLVEYLKSLNQGTAPCREAKLVLAPVLHEMAVAA